MLTAIYIPKSESASPVYSEGQTHITLSENPAKDMPVRVILEGQTIKKADLTQNGNQITLQGDWNSYGIEVDYYIASYIETGDGNEPITPKLPEIQLYSLQANHTASSDSGDDTVDLLIHSIAESEYDIAYNGNDLSQDSQLKSAMTMSVYSDAWVTGEKGWWGDTYHNEYPIADCKLWTLMGKETTNDNLIKGKRYIEEATKWLVQDNYADEIHVTTEHHANELDYLAFEIIGIKDGQPAARLTLTL